MRRLILLTLSLLIFGPAQGLSQFSKADSSNPHPGRFSAVDVYIDPQGKPLAAYQFELSVRDGAATLVGVEGGEHAAFAPPPYYDPRANLEHRIVIAAFNTGSDLPSEKTRVARVMVRVGGTVEPQYIAHLKVAVSGDGSSIPATINVREGASQ